MSDALHQPFTLPCGVTLRNRLAKAAMTERLSNSDFLPNERHIKLYKRWGEDGSGLLITGNMMVDHYHLESAGNIAPLYRQKDPEFHKRMVAALSEMAATARGPENGQVWVQLNHPGRQCSRFVNNSPVSASNVTLQKLGFFAKPRPLATTEIESLVERYRDTAAVIKQSGFTGIQVHAAHGYLLSQFLSPLTNLRTDEWGGSLENRARLLLKVVAAVRETCGAEYPVSVKLNSADFQRGGFGEDDALQVVKWLADAGVDLLEISGGNYENLAFFEAGEEAPQAQRESTRLREAYFLDFCPQGAGSILHSTYAHGGVRSREFADHVLDKGYVDIIGIARPYIMDVDFGKKFLDGTAPDLQTRSVKVGFRGMDDMSEAGYWDLQIDLMSKGLKPDLEAGAWRSMNHLLTKEFSKAMAKRRSRGKG